MHDCQTQPDQKSITLSIIFNFIIMGAAVNFQNNATVCTEEIYNIITYNFLSVEIKAPKLTVFQLIPQQNFREISGLSQLSCFAQQFGIIG